MLQEDSFSCFHVHFILQLHSFDKMESRANCLFYSTAHRSCKCQSSVCLTLVRMCVRASSMFFSLVVRLKETPDILREMFVWNLTQHQIRRLISISFQWMQRSYLKQWFLNLFLRQRCPACLSSFPSPSRC